ncbi:MAG: FIST C-terminal domain-containing protein [Nitrospirae bacterium]|nr:FIST C-terminal domain-containing protein [Nitrospirota bacterium]
MRTGNDTGARVAVAVSHHEDATEAGYAVGRAVHNELGKGPADLAFLFFSSHYANQAETLCAAVRGEFASRVLLGGTGEGIIAGSEEIEGAAAVALWAARLPGTKLTPLRLAFPQGADGFAIKGWPETLGAESPRPTFILLADPFTTPTDEVLSFMADRCPGSAAIGGLVSGGQDLGDNRLLLNDEVYDGGLVGVAVSGGIAVRTVVSQGCRPIGVSYVVTKAEQNVIHELGGSPALDRLQAVFESLGGEERQIAHRALHLGIVIDEHRARFERGDFLVRNLIGADRGSGSVAIGDRVQEGQTVQFHLRDAQSASEDLNVLLAADRAKHRKPPLGALLFSCCGRGRGLFGRAHHDVAAVREREGEMPIAGFFAQGEIGPVGGSNFLHGYTASLALFSEPDA